MQQQPSPALSSPSTGFFGPRASPLFAQSVDQPDPPPASATSEFPRSLASAESSSSSPDNEQAPPKQLAQAMEGLSQALRLIAEVRIGADMMLEALDRAARHNDPSKKASDGIVQAEEFITSTLEALRATGRKLEATGVLNGAQHRFEEKQPWGLQVPLICSDGAIVAYSWKRQIAGQAAASAVDRTRLALKAFTEQKKRFFPGFGNNTDNENDSTSMVPEKKPRIASFETTAVEQGTTLSNLLGSWQTEVPGITITAFTRLEWMKRGAGSICQMGSMESDSVGSGLSKTSASRKGDADASSTGKIAILEVLVPAVFKAVVSLLPSGSTCPDAVSVFAVDEARGNFHLGAASSHAVFRQVTEYATNALHNFLQSAEASALNLLLHWLYSYRSLFSKPCSQCKRVLALDRSTDLLLPPVVRPFNQFLRSVPSMLSIKVEDISDDKILAYHLGCTSKEVPPG